MPGVISRSRDDRRAQLAIAGLIALGVVVRLLAVSSLGFAADVGTFAAWAEQLARVGPAAFYSPDFFRDYPPDYPPVYLYVLWPLGVLFDGEALRLAIKAVSIPADLAIALGAAMLMWRHAGPASAILAAGLWSLSPGAIFAGPYWGQMDALGALPLFASLVAAGQGRWATAGALAALATMVKPQFGIGVLVIGASVSIELVRRREWRPLARAGIAGLVTTLALGAPFRVGPLELFELARRSAEFYPYTSLFAFNVWSIIAGFYESDRAFVLYGAALLGVGLFLACVPLWRRRDAPTLIASGALAAFALYFLPTRAHERYLFAALVLLLPFAATRARVLWPYVGLSLGFAVTLYFAFTRFAQTDLRAPEWLEDTVFARGGQVSLALLMLTAAGLIAWRLFRGDARLTRS